MLRTAFAIDRAPECFVEGELIGLVERNASVARQVGRAAQSRDEVMREIRRADAIGLLRHFGGGTGGQKSVASHAGGLVYEKRRSCPSALDAREGPGRAGIEQRASYVR